MVDYRGVGGDRRDSQIDGIESEFSERFQDGREMDGCLGFDGACEEIGRDVYDQVQDIDLAVRGVFGSSRIVVGILLRRIYGLAAVELIL